MPRDTREQNQLRNGETPAFDRLYADFAPRVLGYLMRLTGNKAEAEDLTQETFLAAYRGREMFAGKSQPLAWLLGIARRRLHDERRRPASQLKTAPPPAEESLTTAEATESDFAESVQRNVTMEAALSRLPDAQRGAILLTAVQGLTHREAALILGEPEGTVKWRVYEATKTLRRLLNEQEQEAQQILMSENTYERNAEPKTRKSEGPTPVAHRG